MNRATCWILVMAVAMGGGVGGGAPAAWGQNVFPTRETGKMTITGRATERPDLTYQLTPRVDETRKGNAATKYMSAAVYEGQALTPEEVALLNEVTGMALTSLDEKDGRVAGIRNKYGQGLKLLREGARLEHADWETNVRDGGIATLLPALGKVRQLSRVLVMEIRLDIQHHNWAAAQDKLQTGFMLARHLCEGETLIETLVGTAIASMMGNCLEDWVVDPGSPNIYWPLSNLPAPMSDVRRAMSYERSLALFSMPEMKEMRAGHFSPAIWNGMVSRFSELVPVMGNDLPLMHVQAQWRDLPGAAAGTVLYPQAKKYLMERGMTAEQVEKMPVAEAVGRYWVRSFDEASDNIFKWMGLPAPAAIAGMKQAEQEMAALRQANQLNLLAAVMLPSLGRAVYTVARLDRQIAMLRIVEAIRAYAAAKGELPESLEALATMLPVPEDPTTGKPFNYQRMGDKGVILSIQVNPADTLSFELTLKK